jgi:putative ABC transport system permease protein
MRVLRTTALVTAAPILLAVAGLVHPRHLTPTTAGDWAGLHIALLPVFPFLVLGLVVPLWGRPRRDAEGALTVLAWLGSLGYAAYYSGLDAVAGISAGTVVDHGVHGAAGRLFATGDALESEIWADGNVVADTYRRGGSRTSVTARLADPQAFKTLKAALEANPQLQVDVSTTLDYFSKQSEGVTKVLRVIGITVGTIMAIGAMFGALNTMFAAVAARAREIATLRAIGFSGVPVVVAVMLETMLLALMGGVLGGLLAWLIFDGYGASTMAAGSVGKLSFALRVSPELLWTGLKWALAIGFIGGLFPAVRAARLPVTTALREL